MKEFFLTAGVVLTLLISTNAYSQDWGIGVRLGDPSGITIKKYMSSGNALEFSVGRTHLLYGRDYFNNRFDDDFDDWYDDNKYGYKDYEYRGHKVSTPIGFQFHYLIQKGISQLEDEDISGFEWYYGFGGQVRFQSYTYDYRYKLKGNSDWFYASGEKVTDLDIGADGVLGAEYTFKDIPISLFVDVTLFMEFFDDPFLFYVQGGIGGRYRF